MEMMIQWLRSILADKQMVILLLVLGIGAAIVLSIGDLLAPVIASVVIAFLLEGLIRHLERFGCPRRTAIILVFGLFMLFLAFLLIALVPLLITQISELTENIPRIIARAQTALQGIPKKFPLLTETHINSILDGLTPQLSLYGKQILSFSLSSVRSVFSFLVYLVLMPIMVFFFLKDKEQILKWIADFLPHDHSLTRRVWAEVEKQAGNYVRGRVWEILIVWLATYACFLITGLEYAMLLSLIVGLSVIIPYIGAVVVTVPVVIIAYIQWGFGPEFTWAMVAYLVVQLLDANLLVPLLLSGAVNLHPLASIMGILVFGGIWGFWGIFFAIPLASLVQAVLQAWQSRRWRGISEDLTSV